MSAFREQNKLMFSTEFSRFEYDLFVNFLMSDLAAWDISNVPNPSCNLSQNSVSFPFQTTRFRGCTRSWFHEFMCHFSHK